MKLQSFPHQVLMDTNERVEAAQETGKIEELWDRRTAIYTRSATDIGFLYPVVLV